MSEMGVPRFIATDIVVNKLEDEPHQGFLVVRLPYDIAETVKRARDFMGSSREVNVTIRLGSMVATFDEGAYGDWMIDLRLANDGSRVEGEDGLFQFDSGVFSIEAFSDFLESGREVFYLSDMDLSVLHETGEFDTEVLDDIQARMDREALMEQGAQASGKAPPALSL